MPAAVERTPLSQAEERQFQQWAQSNQITDVDQPGSFYDYRGYWKEHGNAPIRFGVDHFTDTYKTHGHPTFSVESKYSRGRNDGGQWLTDDVQIGPPMPSHGQSASHDALTDAELAEVAKDASVNRALLTPTESKRLGDIEAHQGYFDESQTWRSLGGNDRDRPDNSVLGVPPELAAVAALNMGRAVVGGGPTMAAKAVAGAKSAVTQVTPQIKYEIVKTGLEAVRVPSAIAIPLAMAISGFGSGSKRAPRTAKAPAPAPAASSAPATVAAPTPVASAPPAAPVAAQAPKPAPAVSVATPAAHPVSAATAPASMGDEVTALAAALRKQSNGALSDLSVTVTGQGNLRIDKMVVTPEARSSGVGSGAMQRLAQFADERGLRMTLSPATAKDGWGTTSRQRLVEFYKRFGFKENKGRSRDLSLSDEMVREPAAKPSGGGAAPVSSAPVAGAPPAPSTSPVTAPASPPAPTPLPVKILKGETLDVPAAMRTPGQMSPASIRMDVGLVARRAKVVLEKAELDEASALVTAGKSPLEAVAEIAARKGALPVPPAGMAEAPMTAARLKLSADEGKVYVLLLRKGKTHQEAVQAIEAQRALGGLPGVVTPSTAARAVADRNATGRWSADRPGTK